MSSITALKGEKASRRIRKAHSFFLRGADQQTTYWREHSIAYHVTMLIVIPLASMRYAKPVAQLTGLGQHMDNIFVLWSAAR